MSHGQNNAPHDPRLRGLLTLSLEDLQREFETGRLPTFDHYVGPTEGVWLHRERQPWWAAAVVRVLLDSPWARWTGKAFVTPFAGEVSGAGANLFQNRVAPLRLQFRTRIRNADHDGRACLALEYPRGSLLRGLIDDVREVDTGVLLGQMVYRFPWSRVWIFVGYFALVRLAPADPHAVPSEFRPRSS